MLTVLLIAAALAAGSLMLALASDAFAYELSRVVEAAFDAVEYRLALRAERARTNHSREGQPAREAAYAARGRVLSW